MLTPLIRQTWTSLAVLVHMYGQGMILSYSSVLLPAILSSNSEIKANLHVASWIASCIGISSIPGYFVSSCLMEWYGRKLAHVAAIVPGCVGWILIGLATNVYMLIAGRVLCGYTAGATLILGAVVIGEYTSPKNRGIFLNLKTTAVCLGNMTVHVLGHFYYWKIIALLALIPHIVAIFITFTWPESPPWLAKTRQFDKCEKSFYYLRDKSDKSVKELGELIRAQNKKVEYLHSRSKKRSDFFTNLKRKDFVKPVTIMFFGSLLCEACGRHMFPAYAIQIIQEVTGNITNSFYYTLGIDIIITLSSIFSSILIKVLKRRTLLFTSGFSAVIVLACVCLYLYLTVNRIIGNNNPLIPIMLFSLYFMLSNLGCTSISLALLGEILPLAHRSAGSFVSGCIISILLLIAMQVTPYLLVTVQVYGTFVIFGLVMILSLIVMYFILPETKDRTLQHIEDYFNFGTLRNYNINDDDDNEFKTRMFSPHT